jgi:hypothetical protein
MKRGLELARDARVDETRIRRWTDMGWTPMWAAKPEVEKPD